MSKIIVVGERVENAPLTRDLPQQDFEQILSFELKSTRTGAEEIEMEIEDSDIVAYEFEDGGEWIGSAIELDEIHGVRMKRGDGAIVLTNRITTTEPGNRGLFKNAVIKVFHILRPRATEKLTGEAARAISRALDLKLVKTPGLFSVSGTFQLSPMPDMKPGDETHLLLLHGTANHTLGSFQDIHAEGGPWPRIFDTYGGRCLALEHHTLSESPLKNALDFLERVPVGFKTDLLSQSRGGVVADVLTRCDNRNQTVGFNDDELELMKRENKAAYEQMLEINRLARLKKIEIGRVIRVSSPSNGTALIQDGLDKFLNVLLNGVRVAFGLGVIYTVIKDLILQIIKHRMDPEYVPGLAALKADNPLLRVLNNGQVAVSSELFVIAGDAEFGRTLLQSILVVLTNLYYKEPNDFIVETDSMDKGPLRASGFNYFLSKTNETQHFRYFYNRDSREAILSAFLPVISGSTPFQKRGLSGERGIVLDMFSLHENTVSDFTGTRPVVILIPGIMGSTLRNNGELIWVDLREISKGKMVKDLHIEAPNVQASGIVDEFYGEFVKRLQRDFDVITFPFDWRKSVSEAGTRLKELIISLEARTQFPIRIVAHSMGGLVVKSVMREYPEFWSSYINRPESRFIMLGTPWMGSYLVMEVLTGHSGRVNQIKYLDLKHDEKDLISVFNKYPGIYDLLPIDDRELEKPAFWVTLNAELKDEILQPPADRLTQFEQYKNTSITENLDLTNCWYVAGKADETTSNYTIRKGLFGNRLQYQATNEGDGSVTWSTGIPKGLNRNNLYYCLTEHGQLANDKRQFEGIIDLLRLGTTTRLLTSKPTYRSGALIGVSSTHLRIPREIEDFRFNLFGGAYTRETEVVRSPLKVKVVKGDLRESGFPVMVGHIQGDAIENAEGAVDRYLKGRLTERKNLGTYPSVVGEHSLFSSPGNVPSMAVVIGLGRVEELTAFNLKNSIEKAIITLSVFTRDNPAHIDPRMRNGISFLLIGTNYGRLPVRESVKAIVSAVRKANLVLSSTSPELPLIEEIEIIDYYEEMAIEAYLALKDLNDTESLGRFDLHGKIESRRGVRKKNSVYREEIWWHQFSTVGMKEQEVLSGLKFDSSAGLARVSTRTIQTGIKQVGILLNQLSEKGQWDQKISKTLFELLIPNEFKNIIRSQNHIVWKMDIEAAQFPWELFHDGEMDSVPTFVNSGLVRQLYSEDMVFNSTRVPHNRALVVGDPLYKDPRLSQLPGALNEASIAAEFYRNNSVETISLLGKESAEIMTALFTEPIKYLHFSGHGLYDPENGEVGIVIGDGITINPSMLNQLSYVPEFVFINCCYSGKISASDNRYYKSRYRLSANIGVELIEKGVKAVIVTGWAVDDAAAETFARTFYHLMFSGYKFGEAIQIARKATFTNHGYTHTWGAYQCYGDPYYAFVGTNKKRNQDAGYVVINQVYSDLEETFFEAKQGDTPDQNILDRLDSILHRANRDGFHDAIIIERTAMILYELDLIERAFDMYKTLLHQEKAYFSVKALELYCYLRARMTRVENTKSKKELETMLSDIERILNIGETRERYSVLGFGFSKAAEISLRQGFKGTEAHLEKMLHHYSRACDLQSDSDIYQYAECLTSKIVAAFALAALSANERSTKETLGLSHKEILDLLDELHTRVEKEEMVNGSSELLIINARIRAVQLLFRKGKQEEALQQVINLYNQAFKTFANTKKITEQLDSYRFIRLFKLENDLARAMDSLIELLEKYRNQS